MDLITLPKSLHNLLVVGPIYNKLSKLDELEKMLPNYDWIVINDSCATDQDNFPSIEMSIKRREKLLSTGKIVITVSRKDLVYAGSLNLSDSQQSKIESWFRAQPNIVLANFGESFRCLIVNGGIPSHISNIDELTNNIEISFAQHPHEKYSGGLGYVISNTPITQWAPRFYAYSAQIANTIDGQVYAFHIDRNGIQRTILI